MGEVLGEALGEFLQGASDGRKFVVRVQSNGRWVRADGSPVPFSNFEATCGNDGRGEAQGR